MHSSQRLGAARVQLGLRVVGAGLLAATGAIHLDLYTNGGFRHIPTIGWLFLLQVIAAFALAVLQLVPGGRLMAALGAGFAVATLGGYLLSIWFGLFGFHEVRTTAGIVAGLIEVATFAVLALLAVTQVPADQAADGGGGGPIQQLDKMLSGLPMAKPAIAVLSGLGLVLLIVAVAGAGPAAPTPSGGTVAIKTGTVGGV